MQLNASALQAVTAPCSALPHHVDPAWRDALKEILQAME